VQRTSIQGAVREFATITCHRLASAIARVILRRHGWTCVVLVIPCGLGAPVARGLVAGRLAGLQPVCGRRRATPLGPALAGPAMTIGRPMSFLCGASSVPGTFGNTSRRPGLRERVRTGHPGAWTPLLRDMRFHILKRTWRGRVGPRPSPRPSMAVAASKFATFRCPASALTMVLMAAMRHGRDLGAVGGRSASSAPAWGWPAERVRTYKVVVVGGLCSDRINLRPRR